jgi:hypothetical protein
MDRYTRPFVLSFPNMARPDWKRVQAVMRLCAGCGAGGLERWTVQHDMFVSRKHHGPPSREASRWCCSPPSRTPSSRQPPWSARSTSSLPPPSATSRLRFWMDYKAMSYMYVHPRGVRRPRPGAPPQHARGQRRGHLVGGCWHHARRQ